MSKSKLIAVLLALMLAITLTAGCSQAELGFLDLELEICKLPVYEASGEVSFALQGIPISPTDTPADTLAAKLLEKGITLKYKSKLEQEKGLMDITISYVNELSGKEQELTRIIGSQNTLYLKVDEIINLINLVNPEYGSKMKLLYGDVEYVSFTYEEYLELLDLSEEEQTFLSDPTFMQNEFNNIGMKIIRGLPEAFKNYNSGLVIKNGNTYTFEATGTEAVEFVFSLFEYSFNNITEIEEWIISFINNLTDEEMVAWGLEPQQKSGYLMSLEMAVSEIIEYREQFLQDINDFRTELQDKEIQVLLNDLFKIGFSISKTEQDTYKDNYALAFNVPEEQISLLLAGTDQYKKISPFTVTYPTDGVISYTEAVNRRDKSIEIQVDSKSYTYTDANGGTQGYIEIKNIENQTYLPMRQITQLFGETVGWDAASNQSYILRGNKKIYLSGIIIEGNTYIKTREFSKLDYEVSWDNKTRTVIISFM